MKKTTQKAHRSVLGGISVTTGTLVALFFLATFAFAFSAYADTRGSADRDRGTTGRTTPPPPSPSPAPTPAPVPPAPTGGITSSTDGSVSSGGNTGGTVTTGDEHVDVHEVNIGPTNPPSPPQDDEEEVSQPAPTPEPQCDGRTRTGCTDTGRTR